MPRASLLKIDKYNINKAKERNRIMTQYEDISSTDISKTISVLTVCSVHCQEWSALIRELSEK